MGFTKGTGFMMKNNIVIKIALCFLLLAAVSLAGVTYQLLLLKQKQSATVERYLLQSAHLISSEINHWVDKNLQHSIMLTKMADITSMQPERQAPLLATAREVLEWMSVIFVMDVDGEAIARSDDKRFRNYSDRDYVKQVQSGQEIGQQIFIGKAKPIPLQCFAFPIKNPQLVGILTQCSLLENIALVVNQQRTGATGIAFLVDEKNRLMAHGNARDFTAKLQDFSEHPALQEAMEPDVVHVIAAEGKDRVVVVNDVGMGWKLVVQQDYDEAYSDYLSLYVWWQYTVVAVLSLVVLLIIFLRAHIVLPLRKITASADQFSQGRFSNAIEATDRGDEIGTAAKAVERLGMSIRLALKRLKSSS